MSTLNPYNWRLVPLSVAMRAMQDAKPSEAHRPGLGAWRPHMERRPDEIVAEWRSRLSRTCYRCGQEFESGGAEINAHEDAHS